MTDESARPSFETGEKITSPAGNVYEIIKKLGEGRCAVVYEALDVTSQQNIALKVYNSGLRYEGAFQREMTVLETLQSLNTKNAVEWYGEFRTSSYHCVILELLECNLRQILFKNNKRGFSLWGIQKFARDIFSGLSDLHSQRMVHADLKPANIHWCPQHGCYKLLDFGLSFHLTEEDIHQVQSTGYQAPEAFVWNRSKQPRNLNSCDGCEEFTNYFFEEILDPSKGKSPRTSSITKVKHAKKGEVKPNQECKSRLKHSKPGLAIDVWSVGCLLMEITTGRKFLKDGDFFHKCASYKNIHSTIDYQLAEVWDNCQNIGLEVAAGFEVLKDLIHRCFEMNPVHRLTSQNALQHPFLQLQLEPSLTDCFILTSKVLLLMNLPDPLDKESSKNEKDVLEECDRTGPVLQTFLSFNGHTRCSILKNYKHFRDCLRAFNTLKNRAVNGNSIIVAFYPVELFEKLSGS